MATKIYNKEGEATHVKAARLQAFLKAGWSVTPVSNEPEVPEVQEAKEGSKKKGKK